MHAPLGQPIRSTLILCLITGIAVSSWSFAQESSSSAASETSPTQTAISGPSVMNDAIIPGPLPAFLRMAGISQKISREEIFPLLARNVLSHGYVGWESSGHPTEFLILLTRYVKQARELSGLVGADATIRVSNCNEAGPLLHVLGYKVRLECGRSNTSLITADPERAFLTLDSGFPLPALEHALQGGPAFVYHFPNSHAPILFQESDWTRLSSHNTGQLVDALLGDPLVARLYWALSRNDSETRLALLNTVGLSTLLPVAPGLDLYGSQLCIRSGHVVVPGGSNAEGAWKDLVGASPASPREFVPLMFGKDKSWLVSYFDALSRISQEQQAHFVQGGRLKHFYEAFRSVDLSNDAARPMFRPAPALLLLLTRARFDENDQPYVPGGLVAWKEILHQKTRSKTIREWRKRSAHWDRPEQLLEAMFAFSRLDIDSGPLQVYLALSDIDSARPADKRLSAKTVELLASRFADLSDQYLVFREFPELSDESIVRFVTVADALDKIPNHVLRGNAFGTFQASVGLWQILARQGQIPAAQLDDTWRRMVDLYASVNSSPQLFDAGQSSLQIMVLASTGKPHITQDELIELLAGPSQTSPEGQRMHREVASAMRAAMDGQRLVALDTLLQLGAGLQQMAHGKASADDLLPMAGALREFEMPRPIFSSAERTEWAPGVYNNRHTDLEMKTDIVRVIKSSPSQGQLEEARGHLTSFLRDTMVGLNYAYYEPPGAQLLRNNPLFVRSHDFSGDTILGIEHVWQAPELFGQGAPAGGGAHLVGSLADLPYVLAEVEQDFISPENVQALIWKEMVPGLMVSSTLPRWWNVTPGQVHAVTLYQKTGEELLIAAAHDEELRTKVMPILRDRMSPQVSERVEVGLQTGRIAETLPRILPADTFYLAAEYRQKYPGTIGSSGPAGQELEALLREHADLSWEHLSERFGTPHPILAHGYALELLNVKPFPALSGYSSRLLAETWDSSNLYWARLVDEMNYAPVTLNRLVPELTRRMIEKIAATDLEDWPAVLRAMREAGDEFRQGKLAAQPPSVAVASH